MMMRGAKITGWGTALPHKIVTNDDLAKTLDTNDEWIRDRTGIAERRIGGTTTGLAVEAGNNALLKAGMKAEELDLIILATTTADEQIPASASSVQNELGATCGAFDLNAACSGFVYALVSGHGFIGAGAEKVLVIGSETMSRVTNWNDRGTAILFGDGAGATVLEATDGPGQLLSWDLGSDGSLRHVLYAEIGGTMVMEGKEVFRQAVLAMATSANNSMEKAGVTGKDIAVVVPHQANTRIISASMKRLGIPQDRAATVLHRTGNTSSASVPLALADALDQGRINDGDLVLLVGFGAGMTSASAVIRWGG